MSKNLFFILFITTTTLKCILTETTRFQVWGPGLKPDVIVMPARYFFLHISDSCSEKLLDVNVEGNKTTKRKCRIWKNILNTRNCTFIIRYKLYESCDHLKITVKYDNHDVGASPYIINKLIYSDDCKCPNVNLKTWLTKWDCGDVPKQITADLDIFERVNFDVLRDKMIKKYNSPGAVSLCHYVIKSNLIYRKCYGKHVGFKIFMDGILLSLSRKLLLPDVEFFVNLGDWPLAENAKDKFPIFSWCGSTDTFDIVMPTYDITESTLENMGRVMLDMLSVQGNVQFDWEDRIPKVFWRGRDSSLERLHLIKLSRKYPHLFNASLTHFFFYRTKEKEYGPKSELVSFFKFFDYKYQLSLDGTVAAYRMPYLLAGGSLVIKQESKYYEHFYKELVAGLHYLPVKRDLSDLVEKIHWAMENDEESQTVANAGRSFAVNNLLPKNIFCYHVHLLNEFSKKIVSNISVLTSMELVEDKISDCDCDVSIKDEL